MIVFRDEEGRVRRVAAAIAKVRLRRNLPGLSETTIAELAPLRPNHHPELLDEARAAIAAMQEGVST